MSLKSFLVRRTSGITREGIKTLIILALLIAGNVVMLSLPLVQDQLRCGFTGHRSAAGVIHVNIAERNQAGFVEFAERFARQNDAMFAKSIYEPMRTRPHRMTTFGICNRNFSVDVGNPFEPERYTVSGRVWDDDDEQSKQVVRTFLEKASRLGTN